VIVGARVTRRHVLRGPDGLGEQQVARFAGTHGWAAIGGTELDDAAHTSYERIWQTGSALTLHYAEDPIIRQSYAFLAGDDPEAVPGIEAELLTAVDHWAPAELLVAVHNSTDSEERGYALVRAALGAPLSADGPLADSIRQALRDPDPGLRKEAVLATTYTGWPSLSEELRSLLTWEDDEEARQLAEAALRSAEQQSAVHHREGP
jgi:hypothetical protein